MSRLKLLGAAALLFLTSAELSADGTAELATYLNTLETFSASFEQQRLDEDGELLERSSGDCQIQRPGRFRWSYFEPYAQLIVSDGATLWIYDPDLEQVTRNDIGAYPQDSPAALLGTQTDIAANYDITALAAGSDGLTWYELRPKSAGADFTAVALAYTDGDVQAMRLTDKLGQVTALSFSAIQRDTALDDALFSFVPPAGVDVVTGGAP